MLLKSTIKLVMIFLILETVWRGRQKVKKLETWISLDDIINEPIDEINNIKLQYKDKSDF